MKGRPERESLAGARYLDLRALARATGRPTAEVLQLAALEGFLARLERSPHRTRLVVKGGVLLAAFDARRPTRDVDLLALRTPNDVDAVRRIVAEVAAEEVQDGLVIDLDAVTAQPIREGDVYAGVRVTLWATLATARLVFHVDVNVGDPIWPGPEATPLPRLLGQGPIVLAAYPLGMVLAEKIVTAIQRGTANTRWRDFADLVVLARTRHVDGSELERSISEVARFRGAPRVPLVSVLEGFASLARDRWKVWHRRNSASVHVPGDFREVLDAVAAFADPPILGVAEGRLWDPALATWATVATAPSGSDVPE